MRLAGPILWFCKRDHLCDLRNVVQGFQSRRSRAHPNAALEYRTMLPCPRALPFDSVICAVRKRPRSGPFAALRMITSIFNLEMACHEQAAERSRRRVEWRGGHSLKTNPGEGFPSSSPESGHRILPRVALIGLDPRLFLKRRARPFYFHLFLPAKFFAGDNRHIRPTAWVPSAVHAPA